MGLTVASNAYRVLGCQISYDIPASLQRFMTLVVRTSNQLLGNLQAAATPHDQEKQSDHHLDISSPFCALTLEESHVIIDESATDTDFVRPSGMPSNGRLVDRTRTAALLLQNLPLPCSALGVMKSSPCFKGCMTTIQRFEGV
ncbi:uncharacterized protein LACBIDRAFT_325978 [Laccaria bicolor S238N-H82]|uniref:Predicted protein n=1 Tax=Laccaria bicolor (strain S238N-H82 / ATCC MYA-4686) TaxID=486041 RepID=B0D6W0_LACBS|nr:uncharacterized protein LACBIDRAFT_325978 [Laccaria bicolor S238N-H82]EDR09544.1 predicted protein [Laccaria bicolor S238N-H82]|eukprot:XP_001879893.1 predicted protein [Laccaria bicolor S238N-H82]